MNKKSTRGFLMSPHRLNYFKILKYYKINTKSNSVCSRSNLPKVKDGKYVINLDEFK